VGNVDAATIGGAVRCLAARVSDCLWWRVESDCSASHPRESADIHSCPEDADERTDFRLDPGPDRDCDRHSAVTDADGATDHGARNGRGGE